MSSSPVGALTRTFLPHHMPLLVAWTDSVLERVAEEHAARVRELDEAAALASVQGALRCAIAEMFLRLGACAVLTRPSVGN